MPELEVKGKKLRLDEDGFLQDWEEWDEEVARALA
ncbi:MAG: TusE/DsrC/DsvC family sulfur relay protein, partial [Archaeoglobaceae archaeon]